MSAIVRKYPALSLLILAMILGTAPLLAVNAGLLPQGGTSLAPSALAWRGSSSLPWTGARAACANCWVAS